MNKGSMKYRKIWEKANGKIPVDEKGRSYEIHHIDGNRNNNSLENLQCLSIEEHYKIHLEKGDYAAANLIAERSNKPVIEGFTGNRKGAKLTEEHKQALIKSRLGHRASEETRKKISNSLKGRKSKKPGKKRNPHSEETKRKMSEKRRGKVPSEEVKQKMRESKKKSTYRHSKEVLEKIKLKNRGQKRSQETKLKISNAKKGKTQQKVVCPFCKKEGGISIMKRHHFVNCKSL